MKKLWIAALVALLALAAATVYAEKAGSEKPTKKNPVVVVVDMGQIVRESNLSKQIQAELQSWGEGMRAQMEPKIKAYQEKEAAFKKDEAKLSAADKTKRSQELDALRADLQQMQTKAQQEYQQRQQAAGERMQAAFGPLMDSLAKERGWDVVLNKGQQDVIWASDAVDQTAAVLARFNAQAPAAPAPAAHPATK
ncbi:MAG: OmpH family outer membrane protein [Acidobacteriota bacterium]